MIGIRVVRPEGWADKSMIAYNADRMPPGGVLPNFVMTQDVFGADLPQQHDRVVQFAERQLTIIRSNLADLKVVEKRRETVADKPAATLLIEWSAQGNRLSQIVTFIERDAKHVVIATATCAKSDFNHYRDVFLRLLHSIEFES